jgi:hypothetical protein
MRLSTLVLAAGLFWPAPAFSQALPGYFMSGNELYTDCTASLDTMERHFCLGYVVGITDGSNFHGAMCVPSGVTRDQITDVVTNYLRAHPEGRDHSAAEQVLIALGQVFPCK